MSIDVDNLLLDGGMQQEEDGTWSVVCVFHEIPNARTAHAVSVWLQALIMLHSDEIAKADVN
jgi:hypothetical protein